MGRIVVTEFVSLDGVMQAPGGEDFKYPGWTFEFDRGDDGNEFKMQETMEADALLIGRVTYESFAAAWPERDGPFADKFNSMPKYVVSSTLSDPEWNNTTVLVGDPVESVRELKESTEGVILLNGSARLAHALTEAGLVDEYRAVVLPVLVADCLRSFPDPETMVKLKLKEAIAYDSGVAQLIYEPSGE